MGERYPGMRELAAKTFRAAPIETYGLVSRQMKHYLNAAKARGVATTMDWSQYNLNSLKEMFGPAPGDPQKVGKPVPSKVTKPTKKMVSNKLENRSNEMGTSGETRSGTKLNSRTGSPISSRMGSRAGSPLPSYFPGSLAGGKTGYPQEDSLNSRQTRFGSSQSNIKARQDRFGSKQSSPAPYIDSQLRCDVVGTCEDLEKPYFRLTGQVNPAVVRPERVLKKSLAHILAKFEQTKNYNYVLEQLQSIRQDLTVQHIESDLTLKVYETNTRVALFHDDLGEFNKCLARVIQLYEVPTNGTPGNRAEFRAYSLLYQLLLRKWGDISSDIQQNFSGEPPAELGEDDDMGRRALRAPITSADQFAMLTRAYDCAYCVARQDSRALEKNARLARPLEQKLLHHILDRQRLAAVAAILTAVKPQKVPMEDIGRLMGTNNIQDIFNQWNLDTINNIVVSEQVLPHILQLLNQSRGGVNIKGQI